MEEKERVPRIAPGGRREIGWVNAGIARLAGLATRGKPPHIFTTLARHRGLFRRWLWFAGALMPGGKLPREETELVILRIAHNTACEYEWSHHERMGRRAGLSAEEISRVRAGAAAPGWSPRRAMLLEAADELHADGAIGDGLWERLSGTLSEVELIELCMLVGHYEMLAMTLNSLRVEPDFAARGDAMRDLRGKRCLITGAASGIGRATAIAAAAKGADLCLTDIQAEALDEVAGEIRRAGGTVIYSKAADVTDHGAIVAMATEIHAVHGSMDVVMNIAGISTWGRIEQLEHSDWQEAIDVDLVGPISVLECFVPAMIEAGRGGHIVNVSSTAGLFGLPWHAPYSAAKFGLRGVSEVLRFDLRRHGIGVSLVCPGAVDTPLIGTVKTVGLDRDDPRVKALVDRFQRHAATPEQVAAKILRGIERNRYMVYTSVDTRVLHWFQRKFAPPYEFAMRYLNDRLNAVARPD